MQTQLTTERKLEFSELRYRRLFEAAQDGILILDATSGKIADANPFLEKILGYSQSELLGKELWQIGVFKDIADSKVAFRELQNKGYIRYKDLPLQTKDGQHIDVEFVSNVYMVDHEKVIQCNIRDISDRRKAEDVAKLRTKELEQLTMSQEKTKQAMLNVMEDLEAAKSQIELEKVKDEAVLASIGEGLIAVDTHQNVMIVNNAAESMLGWKSQELIGHKLTNLTLEDEGGNPLPLKRRLTTIALSQGVSVNVNKTFFFVRKDRTKFPIALNVTPIKLGGNIIGAIDIFRDITHEKEVDRAKSEFVSLASHQLRTPLGIVKWYLEALENETYFIKAPKAIQHYFHEIYKSNERVLSLVRDLLSVSRIDQGQVKDAPRIVHIKTAIKEIVEQMQIPARKKHIELRMMVQAQKMVPIRIDMLRFRETIENLIGNAIAYTPAGGHVLVTVQRSSDILQISVKDNGIGISPSDKKQLFTKFFRSQKAIECNPEGSGLGLYVVRSYIEGWGGSIVVQSSEKKGSTFTIHLPMKGLL